ncbi:MAG: hypothetical protein MI739_10500 [Bacteroidales bacterium]|nr:hypothetical protein [Bacteroidales bacterium]
MEFIRDKLELEITKNVPIVRNIAIPDQNFKVNRTLLVSFDWRSHNGHSYIGGVRDQGSCYAFGAAIEGTYNYAKGKYDNNVIDFSEAYITWCLGAMSQYSSHFNGCNGADYDYCSYNILCFG